MPQPITDQQRASIVRQYLASGLNQADFCRSLAAVERVHVAPRTLRDWCSRFGGSQKVGEDTVRVVAEAVRMLQRLLGSLQAGGQQTVTTETSQVAAGAASQAGHPEDATYETSRVAAGAASAVEAPSVAARPREPEPVGTPPTGTPGGNAHAPIEFMPPEEPHAPAQPLVRRKGRVIFDI
jgi:hypothetical protein